MVGRHMDAVVDRHVGGSAGDVGRDHRRRLGGRAARAAVDAEARLCLQASGAVAGPTEAAAGRGHGQTQQGGDQHRSSGAQDGHQTPRKVKNRRFNVTRDPPGTRNRRARGEFHALVGRGVWPFGCTLSVGVFAAVELEDPAGQRQGAQAEADDDEPPRADRDAVHDHPERRGTPQRPPGVRREEAQLAGPVGDLGVLPVLRARPPSWRRGSRGRGSSSLPAAWS